MANTLSQNDPEILILLAKGYVQTGRTNEAITLLIKAKNSKKDDAEIRYRLFELYNRTGQSKLAQQEIKELVELKRDNKYLLLYAKALIDQGLLKDAENTIEDILATEAENIDALLVKAKIERAKKKYDDAIEVYKEISYIDAEHIQSLCERADTYLLMSKPQWAETFYRRALKADPQYALAELGLARVSKLRKDTQTYKVHLERAKSLDPDNPEILAELKDR
jgi:tetratricopeptide (TPR) repeat protein